MNFKSSRWKSDYFFHLMPCQPPPPSLTPSLFLSRCVFLQRNCLFTWAKNKSCDWVRPTVPLMHYLWKCLLFLPLFFRRKKSPSPWVDIVLEWALRRCPPNMSTLFSVRSSVVCQQFVGKRWVVVTEELKDVKMSYLKLRWSIGVYM